MLVVQTLLAQSVPVVHALLSAQAGHMFPPQSVSVSAAFFTVSLQVGVRQVPPVQTPLEQSLDNMHALPSTHFFVGAHPPPQSVSVSVWFFTPSAHVAATHEVPLQTKLTQSLPIEQPCPVPQRAQVVAPPQSVPVSDPFFNRSPHVGAWQALPVQTPLAQSLPAPHTRFVAHRTQVVAPPQSASVSPPFFVASEQVGALHEPPVQTPLAQSLANEQILLVPHRAQAVVPPQSVSVSPWFLTPSPHVAAWQRVGAAPPQTRLRQSVAAVQVFPLAHPPQVPPPQSTSVSAPFFALSVQPGVWHVPFGQKP